MEKDKHWEIYWNNWLDLSGAEQEYHTQRVGIKSKSKSKKNRR